MDLLVAAELLSNCQMSMSPAMIVLPRNKQQGMSKGVPEKKLTI
jgi:hypothetical protein